MILEGKTSMRALKRFLEASLPDELVFCSRADGPLLESTILNQGPYPALKAMGSEQARLHAFRRGCNGRGELSGMPPAVIRWQMGHTSAAMTALYTGEIPLDQIREQFSSRNGNGIVVLENMENGVAA